MTGAPRPPRLASALVRLIVPSSEAHGAAGDLDEEFARDVSPSCAAWRAHLWYWRESLSLVRAYCVERARRQRRSMAYIHPPTGQPKKGSLMDTVRQDLRQAWRLMTRNPGFAVIAVLVLALGIGAATAIGSAVDAVLLRPLPYVDASTLVIPKTVNIETGQETSGISFPQFLDWKRETDFDRGDELRGIVYVPHRQDSWSAMSLVIRTQVEPAGLTRAVKAEIAALDPALAVADVRTMDEIVFASVAPARFSAMLLGIFAVTAMILAAVGLYGLLAQHVVQRTHEIGVRMALGARVWDVILLVVRQAVTLAAVGIVFGLAGAVALARALRTLLFEVTAGDVPTYVAVTALFAAVTLVACVAPARRAARLDPVEALREH